MKKKEEIKFMDPNEAKVYQWKEGKSRNLRALLCSMDSVIWQDSRWTTCGMHQVSLNSKLEMIFNLSTTNINFGGSSINIDVPRYILSLFLLVRHPQT